MRLFVEITDEQPPDVSKRRWREWCRAGMAAIGNLWDSIFKMRHFEDDAASRYGYQPRAKKYQERKARQARARSHKVSPDAANPLILSGALRKAARQRQLARAFPTRVTVNVPTPHYVAMRPRRAGIPNLGMEMTATTNAERREMQSEFHRTVEELANEYREPRTTTIGG